MRTALTDGVFSKQAETEDEAARVRHEADVLGRLRHPGIVDLRETGDDDSQPWLQTAAITGPSLESLRHDESAITSLIAPLATTLADLHDLGSSHGAVDAAHVLLHHDGRPVLCSLGRSQPTSPRHEAAAGDVRALAELMFDLLGDPPAASDRLEAVRTARPLPRQSLSTLRRVGAAAIDPVWTNRPLARDLADAAWEATWSPMAPHQPRRRHLPVRVPSPRAMATLAAVVVVGASAAWLSGAGGRPPRPKLAAQHVTSDARTSSSVEHDGVRYGVGTAGDTVITGRFDCDNETAAVRTASGGLFIFDHW